VGDREGVTARGIEEAITKCSESKKRKIERLQDVRKLRKQNEERRADGKKHSGTEAARSKPKQK
jgi:hypothetical protein